MRPACGRRVPRTDACGCCCVRVLLSGGRFRRLRLLRLLRRLLEFIRAVLCCVSLGDEIAYRLFRGCRGPGTGLRRVVDDLVCHGYSPFFSCRAKQKGRQCKWCRHLHCRPRCLLASALRLADPEAEPGFLTIQNNSQNYFSFERFLPWLLPRLHHFFRSLGLPQGCAQERFRQEPIGTRKSLLFASSGTMRRPAGPYLSEHCGNVSGARLTRRERCVLLRRV